MIAQVQIGQAQQSFHVQIGRQQGHAFGRVQHEVFLIAQEKHRGLRVRPALVQGHAPLPVGHRNADALSRAAAPLQHLPVEHFLKHLDGVGGHLFEGTGERAAPQLVVFLLPPFDGAGMLIDIVE